MVIIRFVIKFTPVCNGVRVSRSLVFCVMFCRSLFVLLNFLPRSLCCLSVLTASDCLFTSVIVLSVRPRGFWLSFYLGRCVVCPSWRLLIVFLPRSLCCLSVLAASDCLFGIFKLFFKSTNNFVGSYNHTCCYWIFSTEHILHWT